MEFDERMGKCASGVRVCKAPSTRVTSERGAHKKGARSRARLHSILGPAALTRRLLPLLPRFELGQFLKTAKRTRPTKLLAVPTMLTAINKAAMERPIHFDDLDYCVSGGAPLPFDVRVDFVKVTDDTVLVPVTIQIKNKDITFTEKDGISRGTVNILGRVTTLTGRIAQTFEDTVQVDVPKDLLPRKIENASVYWKALPLRSGRYKIDIVVKDVGSGEGRLGTWTNGILVPNMSEDKGLVSSTLILADQMEKVPSRNVGAGDFVLGTTKVRPRVQSADGKPATFKRSQNVNLWMQVYNLSVDQTTKKNSATIEYEIVNAATQKPVVQTKESSAQLGNTGDQMTLEKTMSLASLEPGLYQVTIKVSDLVSKQSLPPTVAKFTVEQ